MKETMTVRSEGRPAYDIVLSDSFEDLGACAEGLGFSARKLCIVTDSNVERLYLDEVRRRYSGQAASRLEGEYWALRFYGEDIRLLRKQQK